MSFFFFFRWNLVTGEGQPAQPKGTPDRAAQTKAQLGKTTEGEEKEAESCQEAPRKRAEGGGGRGREELS